jgi:xanthine dehydrogenase YagR molybdenum-binding subunit
MKSLYACENVRTVEYGARVNSPPMSSFRAPGFTEGTFGLECLLDELAVRLSIDPLELRRRNYASEVADAGRPYSANNLLECYRRIEPYWNRRLRRDVRDRPGCRRGRGLAGQIWYGGGGPPAYAWIRVGSDGRAVVVTATQDIGTGTRTGMAQVAAEELGLPLDWIRVELGDTGAGPYGSISAGSSTISSMGPAVRSAAADAKRQVLELAARTLDRTLSELDVREGRVVASDGESWSIGRACGLRDHAQILGTGARAANPAELEVRTFGVQLAEVMVDVETGEVQVDRVVAVHDVGRILNPLGARSQVEGGIIQAVGHTLSEQRLVDPQSGTVLTQTLDAYGLPTIADVPEIVCEFVDVPDVRLSALGAKGLGEPPVIPTAAAIANAIRDATGADVRSLPITRDVLLQALPREPSIAAGQPP